MVTKNNFPELSDEWVYVPEKHTKLKDQIICSIGNIHLINVLKIYTNNTYWGCIHTSINSGKLLNLFQCKDRKGLSEDFVDNKEAFVNLFKETLSINTTKTLARSEFKTIKPNFLQEYGVKFILNPDGTYYGTMALLKNGEAPVRGLYGSNTEEEYAITVKEWGVSILGRFPTEEEVKTHVIDKQVNALSANFITRVNTAYSNVKVYHRSEINNGIVVRKKIANKTSSYRKGVSG